MVENVLPAVGGDISEASKLLFEHRCRLPEPYRNCDAGNAARHCGIEQKYSTSSPKRWCSICALLLGGAECVWAYAPVRKGWGGGAGQPEAGG